jgi:hypothetical protein
LNSILNSELRAGFCNTYGYGINCCPYVDEAHDYCRSRCEIDTYDGKKRFSYVFMCRVNVSPIHKCKKRPCPEAKSENYTVHFTTNEKVWFTNFNNGGGQNIRPYGILVKLEN